MNLIICAIRDSALGAYKPFVISSVGVATRGFADEVNSDKSELSKHPEDYELYHVANFDEETAFVEVLERPVLLSRGKDVKIPSH